jgi:uncharacterized protein
MSDLILYIVKQLVTNPDGVRVDESHNGSEVNLLLTVAPEDMGLIIGKSGNTIKALRKILIIKAMADNVRVNLQLAEVEGYVKPDKADTLEKDERVSEEESSTPSEATPESSNTDAIKSNPSEETPQESDSDQESENK